MSASRDKTQKTAFVYSNLYQLYRKGQESSKEGSKEIFQLPGTLASEKNVLKSQDLRAEAAPAVSAYQPPTLLAKRIIEKPKAIQASTAMPQQSAAIQSLKDNLKTLNDLHSRLKFMLEELQDLVKE